MDVRNYHPTSRRWPAALNRRQLLRGAGVTLTGAGAAALFGCGSDSKPGDGSAGDGPPEVTAIRLQKTYGVACLAPLLMAREFLPAEGLPNVEYVLSEPTYSGHNEQLLTGKIDFAFNFAAPLAAAIAKGDDLVILGGAHVACFEVFAGKGVESVADLRGKKVAITERNPKPLDYVFVKSVLKYAGIDPDRDVELVSRPSPLPAAAELRNGQLGALLALPPVSQSLRDGQAGPVLINSMTDEPWSQYFCCLIATRRQFIEENPIATRRALRAILRGIDVSRAEPERVARTMADEAWLHSYEYALESMRMIGYGAWREYSPEEALRFYSLRLREAGVITSTPEEIIRKGTDFRFFNELKRELAFAPAAQPRRAGLFDCDIPAPAEQAPPPLAIEPFADEDRRRLEPRGLQG